MIGEITPPLVAHEGAVPQVVVKGNSVLFYRLGDAAEQAAAVGQICGSRGQRNFASQLITNVGRAAGNMGRSG